MSLGGLTRSLWQLRVNVARQHAQGGEPGGGQGPPWVQVSVDAKAPTLPMPRQALNAALRQGVPPDQLWRVPALSWALPAAAAALVSSVPPAAPALWHQARRAGVGSMQCMQTCCACQAGWGERLLDRVLRFSCSWWFCCRPFFPTAVPSQSTGGSLRARSPACRL